MNAQKAQDHQKAHYDKNHGVVGAFVVGVEVLMKDFRRKKRGEEEKLVQLLATFYSDFKRY